jgi:hypothetical protein
MKSKKTSRPLDSNDAKKKSKEDPGDNKDKEDKEDKEDNEDTGTTAVDTKIVPRITNRESFNQAISDYFANPNNFVDIGTWDISMVDDFTGLFSDDRVIDTPEKNDLVNGIQHWNVEHVKSMANMFEVCTHFNQPLNWNTLQVTNMEFMFHDCLLFNQPLQLNTVVVKNTKQMFNNCQVLNQFIYLSDTSQVINMYGMFAGCLVFNQHLDLDTSEVKHMSYLFHDCQAFNQPLFWNTSKVEDMQHMFENCYQFNQPLFWNTSKVEDMQQMFENCYEFNQFLDWNVENVINMYRMFINCWSFNQDLSEWKVNPSCIVDDMFKDCESLTVFPHWYLPVVEHIYPKLKTVGSYIDPPIPRSYLSAGTNLPLGVPMTVPPGVMPFDRSTMLPSYWAKQIAICDDFISTLNNTQKALINQYIGNLCFLDEVDCYVGNRLTTYLLRRHETIIHKYPVYVANPMQMEEYSDTFPVVFPDRNMTLPKLLSTLQGFRDLNVLLKEFPPLDETDYPHGAYVYRGQRYEGEVETLNVGDTFVLSKLTSTSTNVEISARTFSDGVKTICDFDGSGTPKEVTLAFLWRIRYPPLLPFAYIGNKSQDEVVLPLGTKLRYLGSHVQRAGPNGIFTRVERLTTFKGFDDYVAGALICEFQVEEIIPGPLLQDLVDAVNQDFETGRSRIYTHDTSLPDIMGTNPERFLRRRPIYPSDAFGKKRKKTHKRKKPRKTRRRTRSFTHTPKRNRRQRRSTKKK